MAEGHHRVIDEGREALRGLGSGCLDHERSSIVEEDDVVDRPRRDRAGRSIGRTGWVVTMRSPSPNPNVMWRCSRDVAGEIAAKSLLTRATANSSDGRPIDLEDHRSGPGREAGWAHATSRAAPESSSSSGRVTARFIDGGASSRIETSRPRYVSSGMVAHSDRQCHRQIRIVDGRPLERRAASRAPATRRDAARRSRRQEVRRGPRHGATTSKPRSAFWHAPGEIATTSKQGRNRQAWLRRMSPSGMFPQRSVVAPPLTAGHAT